MLGDAPAPQNEHSPFQPRSPYDAAKLYAYWMVRNYRESFGFFVCSGIMFNHESPRRGETFVSRKITRAVSAILAGRQAQLFLGNLDARRSFRLCAGLRRGNVADAAAGSTVRPGIRGWRDLFGSGMWWRRSSAT